jgi:hypothetical protein
MSSLLKSPSTTDHQLTQFVLSRRAGGGGGGTCRYGTLISLDPGRVGKDFFPSQYGTAHGRLEQFSGPVTKVRGGGALGVGECSGGHCKLIRVKS